MIKSSLIAEKIDNAIAANKSKILDAIYLIGKTYVGNNGTQNYLVFQQLINYTVLIMLKLLHGNQEVYFKKQ